jgi:cell fate (sporulation/competence/biofilm development) regulator YlbF (YheA/YmcA/DUF963 family)
MTREGKVQRNLKLSASRAAALDIESALEGKDKAEIVEEALRLREALMGPEYQAAVEAAVAVRFDDDPQRRLEAISALREEVEGATVDGSVSVSAALAKVRARNLLRP